MPRCSRRSIVIRVMTCAIVVACSLPIAAGADIVGQGTPGQKQRRDIGRQWAKLFLCFAKVSVKCEADGGHSGIECSLLDGTAVAPADPKGKFAAAIQKCIDQLDFAKQGSGDSAADYTAMGCPKVYGGGSGGPLGSVEVLQAEAIAALRSMTGGVFFTIDSMCPFLEQSTDPAARDCVADDAAIAIAYVKGLIKCQQKCENDYSGKFGDGGRNNDQVCVHGPLAAPGFLDCDAKALYKATKKHTPSNPSILPWLASWFDTSNGWLFNSGCP